MKIVLSQVESRRATDTWHSSRNIHKKAKIDQQEIEAQPLKEVKEESSQNCSDSDSSGSQSSTAEAEDIESDLESLEEHYYSDLRRYSAPWRGIFPHILLTNSLIPKSGILWWPGRNSKVSHAPYYRVSGRQPHQRGGKQPWLSHWGGLCFSCSLTALCRLEAHNNSVYMAWTQNFCVSSAAFVSSTRPRAGCVRTLCRSPVMVSAKNTARYCTRWSAIRLTNASCALDCAQVTSISKQ